MAKKKKTTKTDKILVNVILDRSGSMTGSRDNTISGYNEYLAALKADKNAKYWVSLVQFDLPASNTPDQHLGCAGPSLL